MVVSALVLTWILSGDVASARAQSIDSQLPGHYRTLVDAYRSGQTDAAIDGVLGLSGQEYEMVRRTVSLARRGLRANSALAPLLHAAALLHTDTAFRCWRTGMEKQARPQLDFARRLVDASAILDPRLEAFRRRWYLATALVHSRVVVPQDAATYFDEAVKALAGDVPMLTAAGWFHERLSHGAAAPGSTPDRQQMLHRRHRLAAERYLSTALQADPSASEASLRLARVHISAGREAEARRILTTLRARTDLAAVVGFVGRLLLGGIHERAGDRSAAERLYREALALDPVAQSARVALGHLLYTAGDAEGAAQAIEPLALGRHDAPGNDPWSDYQLGYLPTGQALLDQLRTTVQR